MDYIAISPQDMLKSGAIIAVETSGANLKTGDNLKILFAKPTQNRRITQPAAVVSTSGNGTKNTSAKISLSVENQSVSGMTKIKYVTCALKRCDEKKYNFANAEYWEICAA